MEYALSSDKISIVPPEDMAELLLVDGQYQASFYISQARDFEVYVHAQNEAG
jgi:hypothetical protein